MPPHKHSISKNSNITLVDGMKKSKLYTHCDKCNAIVKRETFNKEGLFLS